MCSRFVRVQQPAHQDKGCLVPVILCNIIGSEWVEGKYWGLPGPQTSGDLQHDDAVAAEVEFTD